MPLVHGLGQRIGDASANPNYCGLLDAELHCNGVGGPEPDATDVPREAIGVFRHHLHGIRAVSLVNSYRPRRADAVAVQKHHDLSNNLLLGPGGSDPARTHGADAIDLAQALRLRFDCIENLLPESAHEFLGVHGSDPADHAGAEVFLDAIDRRGLRDLQKPGLELLAMSAVIDPFARCGDPLASGNHRRMPNQCDQFAVTARRAAPAVASLKRWRGILIIAKRRRSSARVSKSASTKISTVSSLA